MIKLLLFAPCELIITGEDNRTSLISVLEHLTLRGQILENLPTNAVFPKTWDALALWHRADKIGEPIIFTARVEVFAPNGDFTMISETKFEVSDDFSNFRNTFRFPAFPVGQVGRCKIVLSYKRQDSEDWQIAGEYPINIIHDITETTNESEVENRITVENESSSESV